MGRKEKKYDPKLVDEIVTDDLLPQGYPQRRMKDGKYVVETKWSKGLLKRVNLDGEEITQKINKVDYFEAIDELLKMSRKLKYLKYFTGTIILPVIIKNGKPATVYVSIGSFIKKENSDYRNKINR